MPAMRYEAVAAMSSCHTHIHTHNYYTATVHSLSQHWLIAASFVYEINHHNKHVNQPTTLITASFVYGINHHNKHVNQPTNQLR